MSAERIAVGMSGGVDSAVTAAVLKGQGHDVLAVTLTFWKGEEDDQKSWRDRSCCKVGLARFVAQRLSIPHEVIDLQEAFSREVIDDFCDVYLSGRTPNPCVRCNERIKFGRLLEIAIGRGAASLATGHYAQVRPDPVTGRIRLFQGADPSKDQSYFLYRLSQEQLSRVRFPLGGLRKEEVYRRAEDLGLPYEEVLESQEICFVNQREYGDVLTELRPEALRPGPILDRGGRVLGRHNGLAFYTIGQRRGLRVSSGGRRYVTALRPLDNAVVIGDEGELFRQEFEVEALNWIRWERPPFPLRVLTKLRYRTPAAPGSLERGGENRVRVRLDAPVRGVTPGQSAVFYIEDEVVGGGIISSGSD